jgi:hypothetical protein
MTVARQLRRRLLRHGCGEVDDDHTMTGSCEAVADRQADRPGATGDHRDVAPRAHERTSSNITTPSDPAC